MEVEGIEAVERNTLFGIDRRVIALGFARLADAMGNSFLVVVLPLYIASGKVYGETLGLRESLVTGLVIGLFGLFSSLFQPFAGRLSDRIGKRRLFVILGLVIFTFANLSFIWAHSYISLMVIRVIQGLAAALTITASLALVSELSRRENRGGNMGIYNAFRLVGFGIGPLASGILIEAGPYHLPLVGEVSGFVLVFCVAAAASLISTVLVTLMVRDPKETKPSTEPMVFRVLSKDRDTILDPVFSLGLATFIMSMGFALLTSIEPQLNERLSQGAFLFSVEFSTLVGTLALAQPLVGRASDFFGRKSFILAGMVALAPIMLAEGLATEPWHMILARGFQGICAAMVFAPALALAGDLALKGQEGTQLSVLTVAFGLGISFGAFVSGYAIRFGFVTPFAIASVLSALGAILVYTQVRPDEVIS